MKIEDHIENLEKEIDKMKALYEGLQVVVSKEIKGCEHEWTDGHPRGEYCKKCGTQAKDFYVWKLDKPTQTLADTLGKDNLFKIIVHYDWNSMRAEKEQRESGVYSQYKKSDAVSQVIKDINDYYSLLLQSEYQRGYEEGRYQVMENVKHNAYEPGVKEGRKQAIEEMKEKFNNIVLRVSAQYGDRSSMLHHLKRELFTESK